MIVQQWVPALHLGDAIGGNVLYLDRWLRETGFESSIYAIDWDSGLDDRVTPFENYQDKNSPDTVIIYHFAIPSPMTDVFKTVSGRRVLIYHNITPPEYFIGVDPEIVHIAHVGREQLMGLKNSPEISLADSEFNRLELESMGFAPTGVLPVLFDPDRINQKPSPDIMNMYDDSSVNILSVGRCYPNKGFEDVIKTFYYFTRFVEPYSRLFIVGKYERGEKYLDYLKKLCSIFGLDNVIFTGYVSDAELVAYYRLADIYLGMSHHEGFCMPVVEAMSCHVPVIARETAAIPETLKGSGILVSQPHYIRIAELMGEVHTNSNLRETIIKKQDAVYSQYYDPAKLREQFQEYMKGILWK